MPGARLEGFPVGSVGKDYVCSVRDMSSIPEWGRSLGEGNGYPLWDSCLDNPMDKGACGLQSMGSQRAGHN